MSCSCTPNPPMCMNKPAAAVHQGNRLQLHPAYRQIHGRRLDQRRMEDGGRDQEDPRSHDRGACDLRSGAGVHRPWRSGERRVRKRGDRRGSRALLRDSPGIEVVDVREDGGYVTQLECQGEDAVFVSRIRKDPTVPHGLSFWCVSDNLRKGAALNAVQIAETLIAQGMLAKQAA